MTLVIHNDNATVWLAVETATLGQTIYLPEDDNSSLRSTVDGAFEDYKTGDEEDGTMKFSGLENVTEGGRQGGEDTTIDELMGTAFDPRSEEVAQKEEKDEDSVESMTKKVETLVLSWKCRLMTCLPKSQNDR